MERDRAGPSSLFASTPGGLSPGLGLAWEAEEQEGERSVLQSDFLRVTPGDSG